EIPLLLGVTPYAGYSMFKIAGDYTGDNSTLQARLSESTTTESKIFAGTRISLPLFSVVAQVDMADEIEIYTARINVGF
ncbi:MAG: hypothetical protein ABEK50_12035, partial [bacterium]